MITAQWLKEIDLRKEKFEIKIGDLGFSKLLGNSEEMTDTFCGTPLNMAPEILNGSFYNQKADVWSMGTILFEILTGFNPFSSARDKDQLVTKVNNKDIDMPNTLRLSILCLSFLNMVLSVEKKQRPTFD